VQDGNLLHELAPVAEQLLERHLSTAKEWFPHEMVPWSRARDFERGETWDPEEFPLDESVRSALLVNLLTEDNLPYYFHAIETFFGAEHPWGVWTRRWTAEEGRHAIVIRDYLTVSRALDLVELERGRMEHTSTGFDAKIDGAAECLVYVALQELATRIAHRNTGKLLGDGPGYEIMARVAADENLHYIFYRDAVSAALEADPSTVMSAIARQVAVFEMPGTGIPDFKAHAKRIAAAGIYDFTAHYEQILVPVVLRHWQVESIEGLTPEAEEARAKLVRHIERLGRVARRQAERMQEHREDAVV
jgi:acyl-[acyl-carrier-protein] desaturase